MLHRLRITIAILVLFAFGIAAAVASGSESQPLSRCFTTIATVTSTVVSTVTIAVSTVTVTAPSTPTTTVPTTNRVGAGLAVVRYGNDNWPTTNLPKYGAVFLTSSRLSDLALVKSANPTERVLDYRSPSTLTGSCANPTELTCQSVISLAEAQAHDQSNPGDPWVLRDSSGNPIGYKGNSGQYWANVGSASFRQAVLSKVLSAMTSLTSSGHHFDGVMYDNASNGFYDSAGAPTAATAPSTLYPDNASWEAAMKGLLDVIGPGLTTQGYYVAANCSAALDPSGDLTMAWWTKIAPDVSGFFREYWENGGSNGDLFYNPPGDYRANYNNQLRLVDTAQNLDRDFYGGTDNLAGTVADAIYVRSAFLLKWNGKGGGYVRHLAGTTDPWDPAWTVDIGTPIGAMYAVGNGWRRDYTAGTVIVNPNCATCGNITFNLGGTYKKTDGTLATSVTLAPTTAMILTLP